MKNLFFALSLITTNIMFSQPTVDNQHYDKFAGHWRWVSNTDTFEIFLKVNAPMPNTTYKYISGVHRLVRNGVVTQSTWKNNTDTTGTINKGFFTYFKGVDPNVLDGGFMIDWEMRQGVAPNFKYNSNGTITYTCRQGPTGNLPNSIPGQLKLPNNVILIKQ